jgi:C1A family cysteine protease
MKHYFFLSMLFMYFLTGVLVAQDSNPSLKIQQENLKFYQQRELAASVEVKAILQTLREHINAKKYTFQVGYTTAMNYKIEQITGLVAPSDLNEQIKNQKITAKRALESTTPGACSAGLATFDWRNAHGCTPVRDQFECGSCWDFATCGAFEGSWRIINDKTIDCSEQQILDCNPWGYNCNGGWWAHQYLIDTGVAKESDYPYTRRQGTCNRTVTKPYRAVSWGYVGSEAGVPDITSLKQALCQYGPLSVAVLVTPNFQAYTSGILNETANAWSAATNYSRNDLVKTAGGNIFVCSTTGRTGATEPTWSTNTVTDGTVIWRRLGVINHGVTLIGWDDNKGAWLIKNSWGINWGETGGSGSERGYMWISYNTDNIGYAAAWVQAVKSPVWRNLGLSLHSGTAIPRGDFANVFDPGLNTLVDITYRFNTTWSLVGFAGYNKFKSKIERIDDLSVWNLSLNLRYYRNFSTMPGTTWAGYIGGGPGLYLPNRGDNKFGYNLGAGIDYAIRPTITIECGADYHKTSDTVEFLHTHIGLIFWL